MDRELFEAALTGDVQKLHQLLLRNPLFLQTAALSSAANPLHVASAYGHIHFVKEIIRLKPEYAKEVNQDDFSSMHVASANGYVEIVRELIKVDPTLCLLQGRDKKTPLHCAAIKGRGDVISEMLSACPDCAKYVTVQRETALHLAVKNNQFEGIRVLLDWIRDMKKESILNMKDEQGNTVLHLRKVEKSNVQVMELLFGNGVTGPQLLEVNATDQSVLTALDVLLIFPSKAGDREIKEILRSARAMRKIDIIPSSTNDNQIFVNTPATTEGHGRPLQQRPTDLEDYFKFKKDRDSPGEARNALLIIAVLVATATFQAGMNPPGGVWQDNGTSINNKNKVGSSILGSVNAVTYGIFMASNSIGFALSLHMIYILTHNFPLQLELQVCMLAMFSTYNTAVPNLAPEKLWLFLTVLTAILPEIIPFLTKWVRTYMKRIGKLVVNIIPTTRFQMLT
ncbi:LOW QUALITY PROTEIN: ankyrin repeat-containing protein BDA1-like [Pistacia vera]|uniref:LOW QUALITY PROTEIN: ankyrin repeat-containing protein BDA1-like n=1 Tax=Pistacia vera TaxID=55513 RepID=UPI001263B67C|nr:LOW QUALITY PROTEIN: ankyrin repeat-containing protein BDA1-like [Pistacia vera]